MSVLHAKRTKMPLPVSLVLISPWLDLTLNETLESPAIATDFLINFKSANPGIVQALLPAGFQPGDPQVSPLFDNLSSLPPQLVFAGTAEVLLPDAVSWVERSRAANNKVVFVRGQGEMHT
jgi:acetyl esterase/lipase